MSPARSTPRTPRSTGLALAAFLLTACGPELHPAPPARNVVLIVVDTLRTDALGLYGYERDTSPFLDRWASERGVVFDNARAPAPWTKPSVASLLTGLDPGGHGVRIHTDRLHVDLRRLPEAFAEAGFQTAAVQSNMLVSSIFGYQAGFDFWHEEHVALHDLSTGEEIQDLTSQWLREERDPERPFFLYVHHYEPHFAYLRDGAEFEPEPYAGPLVGDEPMHELIAANDLLTQADVIHLRARYDAEVRYQDELVERLWGELEALGLAEDTLVAFTADHGEEFHEHGELSHQHKLYDELLRVPLVIARPGEPAPGRRVPDAVSTVDVGRTLLDLAGLVEAPFPGQSLAPLVVGGAVPPREVFSQVRTVDPGEGPPESRMKALDAVVADGWKLVRDPLTGEHMLFDLAVDPGELDNRAADEPERVRFLGHMLDRWLSTENGLGELGEDRVELTEDMTERLRDLGYL